MTTAKLPVVNRKCGSCSACCYVLSVREGATEVDVEKQEVAEHGFKKPRYTTCPHQKQQSNNCCGIYETRPEPCKTYSCCWLQGLGSNSQRPDKSGIVFSTEVTSLGFTLLGLEVRPGQANWNNHVVQLAYRAAEKGDFGLIVGGKEKRRILRVPEKKRLHVQKLLLEARAQGYDLVIEELPRRETL